MKISDAISLAGLAVIMTMLFVAASDGPLRPVVRLVREDPKLADFIDPAILAAGQQHPPTHVHIDPMPSVAASSSLLKASRTP